jgi:hypothetical protein
VSEDIRSEQERRQRLAEQLASSGRGTTAGAAPSRPATSRTDTAGMATRRVGR